MREYGFGAFIWSCNSIFHSVLHPGIWHSHYHIGHGIRFSLVTCMLKLGDLATCLYIMKIGISIGLSHGFLLFHHYYDIALCLELFGEEVKQFVDEFIVSILRGEEGIELFVVKISYIC